LQKVHWNGRELPGHLLGVRRHPEHSSHESAWPLPIADAYVRGDDLIAVYQPADAWPYAPQLYWTAGQCEDNQRVLASLSLLISVETHLLDTWPRITVGSRLACREVLQVDTASGAVEQLQSRSIRQSNAACCLLYRVADLPISVVESMPASDFRDVDVRRCRNGEYQAEWHVFADFLEKGVIRKARFHCAFVPAEDDVRSAIVFCAAEARRPLPLTT
jgi:hypothetical protein